jgi:hypothetical protein
MRLLSVTLQQRTDNIYPTECATEKFHLKKLMHIKGGFILNLMQLFAKCGAESVKAHFIMVSFMQVCN